MTGFFLFLVLFAPLSSRVQTGADRLLDEPYLRLIEGKRVGLITNQTGISRNFVSTVELLERDPRISLTALFAPEHGIYGSAQAGEEVPDEKQIYSLYGETRAPTPAMLKDVDVLIYDIQDVGSRFYTFISTMYESMRTAAAAGIPFLVLDRPVAIAGRQLEGPVLEPGFESFVGIFRLPIRYAMTAGELAQFFNAEAGIGCKLSVVPLKNWKRKLWFDQTGLPWVAPSPNMPSLATATVYPGLCLIEGTNLSEGRGTTRPFEWIGAPWLDHLKLARELNRLKLPGVHFRPQVFTPTFSKYEDEACRGIEVHVTDRTVFPPVRTVLHILEQTRRLHPQEFEFRSSFDRLAGNSWIREKITEGVTAETIVQLWQEDLRAFEKKRKLYLKY